MTCSTCRQSIINDICGCGCGSCKPFATPTPSFHCDSPPPAPACGTRIVDGVEYPVYHSVHPLIPLVRNRYPELIQALGKCCNCEEAIDQELAKYLTAAETMTSTCGFPGQRYFEGVMLYAMARIELVAAVARQNSMEDAMIGKGRFVDLKPKRLEDMPSWQLREELKVKRFATFSNAWMQ
jgi:hypothetical protein